MISLRDHITFCLFCVKLFIHSKNCHPSGQRKLFLLSIKHKNSEKFLCHHQKSLACKNVQQNSQNEWKCRQSLSSLRHKVHKVSRTLNTQRNASSWGRFLQTLPSTPTSSQFDSRTRHRHVYNLSYAFLTQQDQHELLTAGNLWVIARIKTRRRWSRSDHFGRKHLPWSIFIRDPHLYTAEWTNKTRCVIN